MLVALTRERGHNAGLLRLVADRATVVEIPLTTTRFRPLEDVSKEIHSSVHFGSFLSLVASSSRVARYLDVARDSMATGFHVFSTGVATSAVLAEHALVVTHQSSDSALQLADVISEGPVLLLGAVNGRDELPDELVRCHLDPVVIECYETIPADLDDESVDLLRRADVVFIGAPSAWRTAQHLVSADAWVLVPGTTTLDAVRATHERVLVGWGRAFEAAWAHVEESVS
ncbi:MAG TPA: uroporphyrinogen-III synthase [Acidimicrobiales bacterium]